MRRIIPTPAPKVAKDEFEGWCDEDVDGNVVEDENVPGKISWDVNDHTVRVEFDKEQVTVQEIDAQTAVGSSETWQVGDEIPNTTPRLLVSPDRLEMKVIHESGRQAPFYHRRSY